jgi:hypothetical protein
MDMIGDLVRTGETFHPHDHVIAVTQDRAWIRDTQSGARGSEDRPSTIAASSKFAKPSEPKVRSDLYKDVTFFSFQIGLDRTVR